MRRAAFLSLSGLSADTYKNMVRHQHAPTVQAADIVGEDAAGWAEYSLGDVVMTATAVALNGEGLDKGTACAMTVRGFSQIKAWWPEIRVQRPSVFFGAADVAWDGGDKVLSQWFPIAGALQDIRESEIGHGTKHKLADVERQVRKIVIVNLSGLRGEIQARAEKAGLLFDFDHLEAM